MDRATDVAARFLALLERDLKARPADAVRTLPEGVVDRLDALAAEVGVVDIDEAIEGEVSL